MLRTDYLPNRTLNTNGTDYLYFSGTSYLGMACNPRFQEYLQEGIARYGTNYSSSRLSNVQLTVFKEAEEYLAGFIGTEAALTVSSGFLAGQLVVRTLATEGTFWYGPRAHPALLLEPGNFHNEDFSDWIDKLPGQIKNHPGSHHFILCNSLDPLEAKAYSWQWLSNLPQGKEIILIVDDSHGLGVIGEQGAGILKQIKTFTHLLVILISSIGKALGIPGGVIAGDGLWIQKFKNSPFFGGGSPVIPAYLYAFIKSATLYEEARQKLFNNINYFISGLQEPSSFQFFDNYPVFYTPQNNLYNYLLHREILISSFPYPTPQDSLITRIVLNSLHTLQDIDKLTMGINQFKVNIAK